LIVSVGGFGTESGFSVDRVLVERKHDNGRKSLLNSEWIPSSGLQFARSSADADTELTAKTQTAQITMKGFFISILFCELRLGSL